jgi:hypothetical protein
MLSSVAESIDATREPNESAPFVCRQQIGIRAWMSKS